MPTSRQVSRSTCPSAGSSSGEEMANKRPASTCLTTQGYRSWRSGSVGRRSSRAHQAWAGVMTPGLASDHRQSTARSRPSGSETRRSVSSSSRSTSAGGRFMNREDRSETSVSNSRRLARLSAEGCGRSPAAGTGQSIRASDWRRNIDPWAILRPARTPSPVRRPRARQFRNPSLSAVWPPVTDLAVRRHGSSTTEERASTGERDRRIAPVFSVARAACRRVRTLAIHAGCDAAWAARPGPEAS